MPTKTQLKEYRERARVLKKNRLIDFDLRKKPTDAQRAAVTRMWRGRVAKDPNRRSHYAGWGSILENPDTVIRKVSKKKARRLRELGYRVDMDTSRVFMDSEGANDLHIRGDSILRTYDDREVEDLLIGADKIHDTLEHLIETDPLAPNEFATVRIGDHSPFNVAYDSLDQLYRYINKWTPDKDFHLRDDLINQMSIVRFTDDEFAARLGRQTNGKRKKKTRNTRRRNRSV